MRGLDDEPRFLDFSLLEECFGRLLLAWRKSPASMRRAGSVRRMGESTDRLAASS
jgi:hypothetical protein